MNNIELTNIEKEYLYTLLVASKESLDDICVDRKLTDIDWYTQEEVDEEYAVIDSLMEKLG